MSEEISDRKAFKLRMFLSVLYLLLLPMTLPFFLSALLAYGTTEETSFLDTIVFCASITLPLLTLLGAVVGMWCARGVRSRRKNILGRVFLLLPLCALLVSLLMYV